MRISEAKLFQAVLRNAIEDIETGLYPTNGRLCEDIESLGYSQKVAVETVFVPRVRGPQRELGARVCESCIEWVGCPERVVSQLKMDEVDPLMMREEDRNYSDEGLKPSRISTARQVYLQK